MAEETRTKVGKLNTRLMKGARLQIVLQEDKEEQIYLSQIIKFDETSFFITPPLKEKEEIQLSPKQEVFISYQGPDALYEFVAKSLHVLTTESGIRQYEFEIPGVAWRIQRRNYFRVPLSREGKLRKVRNLGSIEEPVLEPDSDWQKCFIVNLSGGGIGVIANTFLRVEDFGEIQFKLHPGEDEKVFQEFFKVVRLRMAQNKVKKDTYEYAFGAFFYGISKRNREELISFVHEKQQEIARRQRI